MTQSERTKNIAFACAEIRQRVRTLIDNNESKPTNEFISERRAYFLKEAVKKYKVKESTIIMLMKNLRHESDYFSENE